jgi:branched-chain amino acid aminotransferase
MTNYDGPSFLNFDGAVLPAGQGILTADNRGFRYGDGLFETMLAGEGRIRLWRYHFERLLSGMRMLRFEPTAQFTSAIERQILELCAVNGHAGAAGFGIACGKPPATAGAGEGAGRSDRVAVSKGGEGFEGAGGIEGAGLSRVRLTVFRGDGGLTDAIDTFPHYIIQSGPWPVSAAGWNAAGLVIDIFAGGCKACDMLSTLKSNNYLLYSLAATFGRERGLDDCLVLNSHGRLADSTIANLFYIKDNRFYTPPLSEGCVAGVMRRYLLEALPQAGYSVQEQPVSPEDLAGADEVFLTNALRGIRWVRSFRGVTYGNRLATAVHEQIIRKI